MAFLLDQLHGQVEVPQQDELEQLAHGHKSLLYRACECGKGRYGGEGYLEHFCHSVKPQALTRSLQYGPTVNK